MRGVLQVLVDQVSLQQTTSDQIMSRLTSLEDASGSSCAQPATEQQVSESSVPVKNKGKRKLASTKLLQRAKKTVRSRHPKVKEIRNRKQAKSKTTSEPGDSSNSNAVAKSNGLGAAPIASPEKPRPNALSPSEIDSSSLSSIDSVLQKYRGDVEQGKMVAVARKLAVEAVFGEGVLRQCTPSGRTSYPALPISSLYTIKQAVLDNFPRFWDKPEEFKKEWTLCKKGIERCCAQLRDNGKVRRRRRQHVSPQNSKTSPSNVGTTHGDTGNSSASPDSIEIDVVSGPPQGNISSTENGHQQVPSPLSAYVAIGPAVKPITSVYTPLPSSEIDTSKLMSVEKFMQTHSAAIRNGKYEMSRLSQKLAAEVVFGKDVLIQCTPFGKKAGLSGFPVVEFNMLKQLVLDCFPSYWDKMEEFEKKWIYVASGPLGKSCSFLRNAAGKN